MEWSVCMAAGCMAATRMVISHSKPGRATASEEEHVDRADSGRSVAPVPAGSRPVGHHQASLLTLLPSGRLYIPSE